MSRTKKDPTAWRNGAQGIESYRVAKAEAQRRADESKIDVGLEANDLFHTWSHFFLPAAQYRNGHEQRCEVVRPTVLK
jgi:hypothetical protein